MENKTNKPEKGIVAVTDTVRILVESDNVLTVQIASGEKDEEVNWKNDGYFGDWNSCLKDVHRTLVNKHIIKKANVNLLELKDIFEEVKRFLEKQFEPLIK